MSTERIISFTFIIRWGKKSLAGVKSTLAEMNSFNLSDSLGKIFGEHSNSIL